MKTKEELAEEYAKKEWPYWTTSEMFLNCKTDFLAGWDACNSAREKDLEELEKVVNFLLGSGELDSFSYGERPAGKAPFWWRENLRKAWEKLSPPKEETKQ
jgi:hypothetical protein